MFIFKNFAEDEKVPGNSKFKPFCEIYEFVNQNFF